MAVVASLPTRRGIATRIDVLRSTGLRHAARRWRRDRALRPLPVRRKEHIARALWVDAATELDATPALHHHMHVVDATSRVTVPILSTFGVPARP